MALFSKELSTLAGGNVRWPATAYSKDTAHTA
jgi:hypothetical protein